MGIIYVFSHSVVHIAIMMLIGLAFKLDAFGYFILFLSTALVDLDHLQLWIKQGMRGYLLLRSVAELGKPRKYAFHKLYILFIAGIAAAVLIYNNSLLPAVAFTAVALHLSWDLFEDMIIFKTGINHWI